MNDLNRQPNFWARGKREQKKFYDIKLNRSTNIKTFIFGFLISLIIMFPFAYMIYQYLIIFGYNRSIFGVYLAFFWVALMIFNGLSNYLTVKMAQSSAKDIINLQAIEARYILIYQMLNIGFGMFSLIIIIIFGVQIIGAR